MTDTLYSSMTALVAERSRSTNPLVFPFLSLNLETEPKKLYNKKRFPKKNVQIFLQS